MISEQHTTESGDPAPTDAETSGFGQLAALVHAFIGMMQAGGIARMDIEHGGLRLSLRAHEAPASPGVPLQVIARQDNSVRATDDGASNVADSSSDHIVRAPMIGTFYTASSPNDPPFVQPGDVVEEGQTIGIIEAMKIMNEIAADRAGTISELLAQNAQTVEYGSPLVRLTPSVAD